MRATGPAKGEQPATAVPDSRTGRTPSSGGSSTAPDTSPRGGGREAARMEDIGARVGGWTTETPEDGPSAGARSASGPGDGPGRGRRGQGEREGVRVTSPFDPMPDPREPHRGQDNVRRGTRPEREAADGPRPSRDAARRPPRKGVPPLRRAGNPACRGKRTESARVPGGGMLWRARNPMGAPG